ncbi:biotin/lipoyl-containing protein [Leucothrix mucor]|uniref:biotin/lipoyl-containing protein n=1 Tax=Leucothrix mucor TaxID=45248 RepID=UPI0003B5D7EE|nr:lipoyl domain-containing protein [Leucothrix mucor]
MATDIIIPADLWEEDSEGVITSWLVSEGAQVEAGTPIAEVMVEKAQFEVESQLSGTITLLKEEDDLVEKGDVIARVTS